MFLSYETCNMNTALWKKVFLNYSEASYYKSIYNTFPNHAKWFLKKKSNVVYYNYIQGKEWGEVIHGWYTENINRCKFFWNILWKFHFKHCKISAWYENICRNRNYVQDGSVFYKSCLYEWFIHWDLHLKNIIINDSWIFFIDRLLEYWDIMFDFPFIMSFLCFRYEKKDLKYLDYILIFFIYYSRHIIWSKKAFFTSFRNNFINYWIVCSKIAKQRSDFSEWRYWEIISQCLVKEMDFISFIENCYKWSI